MEAPLRLCPAGLLVGRALEQNVSSCFSGSLPSTPGVGESGEVPRLRHPGPGGGRAVMCLCILFWREAPLLELYDPKSSGVQSGKFWKLAAHVRFAALP